MPTDKNFIYNREFKPPFNYILIAEQRKYKQEKIKVALSKFNETYHRRKNLQVRSFLFNDDDQIYMVRSFSTQEVAMRYFKEMATDKEFLIQSGLKDLNHFIITTENLRKLIKAKDEKEYVEFFDLYYLKKSGN